MNKREKLFIQNNFHEVLHTTFNPNGPGVVRLHLIPSNNQDHVPSVVIINGKDIIPINKSWAFLLAEFIKNVNTYEGKEVSDENLSEIVNQTVHTIHQLYKMVRKKRIRKDLWTIIDTLCDIAYGKDVASDIGYLNIGEYAPYMTAPHRMDLMVSAMTKEGLWHCNQKCLHCYAAGQNCSNEHELSTKDWKLVIDKCKSIGISQLTFTGGEPTMRDDLPELIQHARWFITRLNTNGVLLSEEYCRRLKASEVDNIQITFYSHDKNIHNKLVGADNYDKTVDGIKNALSTGISVSINTPLCTLNQNYKETLQFLHNLGVLYVTCSGLIITGNATNEISKRTQLTQKELLQTLTDAVNYCNDNKMELSFTSPGWLKEEDIRELGLMVPSCGACLSNMAITPSGMVVPCQSWLSDEPLGNFLQDDWSSIWKSHRCQSVKENSRKMLQSCPLKAKEDKQL